MDTTIVLLRSHNANNYFTTITQSGIIWIQSIVIGFFGSWISVPQSQPQLQPQTPHQYLNSSLLDLFDYYA